MVATNSRDRLILWIAQGFGTGCAPVAPGTFGTLVGIGWFALLLLPGSLPVYMVGTAVGVFASAWICGEAERILGAKDPGSVVLDEIIAIPISMLGWVVLVSLSGDAVSLVEYFFVKHPWSLVVGFVLFRVFDILKPWPVYQIQSIGGGWGVTMDDVLAGVYVNVLAVPALLLLGK